MRSDGVEAEPYQETLTNIPCRRRTILVESHVELENGVEVVDVVGWRRRMFHRREPQTLAWKFGEHGMEH